MVGVSGWRGDGEVEVWLGRWEGCHGCVVGREVDGCLAVEMELSIERDDEL